MIKKRQVIIIFILLLGYGIRAQEHAFDLMAGVAFPAISSEVSVGNAKSKAGLIFGVLYRKKNARQNMWSLGIEYQLLRRSYNVEVNNRKETATDRFELLQVGYDPIYWFLDKKQHAYVGAGIFVDYLLHEETELVNNLTNDTKSFLRTSVGPSLDFGVQLGESMRKSLILGLRGNLGAISFGKTPLGNNTRGLVFRTVTLYAGLGI